MIGEGVVLRRDGVDKCKRGGAVGAYTSNSVTAGVGLHAAADSMPPSISAPIAKDTIFFIGSVPSFY